MRLAAEDEIVPRLRIRDGAPSPSHAAIVSAPGASSQDGSSGLRSCRRGRLSRLEDELAVLRVHAHDVAKWDGTTWSPVGAGLWTIPTGFQAVTDFLVLDDGSGPALLTPPTSAVDEDTVRSGPRVGVAAAHDLPWRFWLDGEPSVSAYRRHTPRRRPAAS